MEVTLENGFIIYENEVLGDLAKPVNHISVSVEEDIHDVVGVYRITNVCIDSDGVDYEILEELNTKIYNICCDREFFYNSYGELKREVSNFLSHVTGVSKALIDVD